MFKPELSNEEGKPTTSEEGEDHVAEVVDSKPTIMKHEVEPIYVVEKFEVEIHKSEAKTTDKAITAEEADKTSNDQFDDLVESTDECFFVAPVCNQSPNDDISSPVHSEIQFIFTATPIPNFVMAPEIVFPVHVR